MRALGLLVNIIGGAYFLMNMQDKQGIELFIQCIFVMLFAIGGARHYHMLLAE
jgi:hypothetical protein